MKNISTLALAFLSGYLLLTSCSSSDATETTTETTTTSANFDLSVARTEIEEANRRYMELVASGDSVGLANA